MERITRVLRRLFFYSSRQLVRRRRTYRSVFISTTVLLTLVMTALMLFDSYYLASVERASSGTHHIAFLDQLYDFTEEIGRDRSVTSVFAVPSSSKFASSVDASAPGKIVVETEETDRTLGVRYIWGHAPGEGEVAVSLDLYRACPFLKAGDPNDLYFKATRMTYREMTLSGIFTISGVGSSYVFLSQSDAASIDAETGAILKYDHFIRVSHATERGAAKVADRLYRSLGMIPTDAQNPREAADGTRYLVNRYAEYLNTVNIKNEERYSATPVTLYTLPVILAASLILASFMTDWSVSHAPEFGNLSALGANRIGLCAIPAGQILLLTLIASTGAILLAGLLSRIYLSAMPSLSAAALAVPWKLLVSAAVRFALFSAFFTWLGIARLTRETPYELISGSFRAKMPFVRRSFLALSRLKDKIAALSVLMTLRRIASEIIPAVVASLVSMMLGAAVLVLIRSGGEVSAALFKTPGAADTVISVLSDADSSVGEGAPITDEIAGRIQRTPGVASVGTYSFFGTSNRRTTVSGELTISDEPMIQIPQQVGSEYWRLLDAAVADGESLPLLVGSLTEGSLDDPGEDGVILLLPNSSIDGWYNQERFHVGDVISARPRTVYHSVSGITETADDEYSASFTVTAVGTVSDKALKYGLASTEYLMVYSPAGGQRLGLIDADDHRTLLVNYDPSLGDDKTAQIVESFARDTELMRYAVKNTRVLSSDELKSARAVLVMLGVCAAMTLLAFFVMTSMNAGMKASKARAEFAALRQMGADDAAVYKTTRIGTYPTSALAALITLAVLSLASLLILTIPMYYLNVDAHDHPLTYTLAYYSLCRREILERAKTVFLLLPLSLPMHIFAFAASVLGTRQPTKRLLDEPITEGLRKDTD